MYWTLSSLGKNLTDTVVTRHEATLVTHGPYRWVRHPFYVTAALLMLSATIIAANWLIGLSGLVVMVLLSPSLAQRPLCTLAKLQGIAPAVITAKVIR